MKKRQKINDDDGDINNNNIDIVNDNDDKNHDNNMKQRRKMINGNIDDYDGEDNDNSIIAAKVILIFLL